MNPIQIAVLSIIVAVIIIYLLHEYLCERETVEDIHEKAQEAAHGFPVPVEYILSELAEIDFSSLEERVLTHWADVLASRGKEVPVELADAIAGFTGSLTRQDTWSTADRCDVVVAQHVDWHSCTCPLCEPSIMHHPM